MDNTAACPYGLDTRKLREEIRSVYGRVAEEPGGDFHFNRGPEDAARLLGYDAAALAELPRDVTASFAGVANPHRIAPIRAGETVLDVGCGAGMDLLLAARAVGARGKAIGVDMTAAMRERALFAAAALGLANVEVLEGVAEALPLPDASVDTVISNGVLNLAPDKDAAFGEIARVLAPGGRLLLADIVIGRELSPEQRSDVALWTG